MKILDHAGLERTLLSNFPKFVDRTKLINFVLQNVRDQPDLTLVQDSPVQRNMQLTLSRFDWKEDGHFELWMDYTVPTERGIAIGTCEALLLTDGTISHKRTTGVIFLE